MTYLLTGLIHITIQHEKNEEYHLADETTVSVHGEGYELK